MHPSRRLDARRADNEQQNVTSLDSRDGRMHVIRVAGPTALLVTKVIKEPCPVGVTARLCPVRERSG